MFWQIYFHFIIIIIIIYFTTSYKSYMQYTWSEKRNYNKLREHSEYLFIRKGASPTCLEEKKLLQPVGLPFRLGRAFLGALNSLCMQQKYIEIISI